METSTEGVAAAAADDPPGATRPGTTEAPDTTGTEVAPTAEVGPDAGHTAADDPPPTDAAQPAATEAPDTAATETTRPTVAGRGDGAADADPRTAETSGAARPGTAGEPDTVDAGATSATVVAGQEDGDTAADDPRSGEAAQPRTVAGTTPTARAVGRQDGGPADETRTEDAAQPRAAAGTAPTAVAAGRQGGGPADETRVAEAVRAGAVEVSDAGPGTTLPVVAAGARGGDDAAGAATDTGAGSPAAVRTHTAPASLSPSRANDFMQCPLLYRFRVIDRLPEKPSAAATRGTLVHSVLERLFDAPAGDRTAPAAKSLIPGQWDRLRESRPEVLELFADDPDGERLATWLGEAERLVERWFTLEDPTRLEPAERELFVEAELDSGLRLRGIIDRVDVAPTGEVRIVDYKTGKAPRPEYAEGALFQMKFYALVVWRLKKVIPRRLQLVYLGSGDVLTYDPVLADLERVERKLLALWEAIRQATETGDWRPRPTKLCGWCDHQEHCPEFGGTPPPYPLPVEAATGEQGRMGPD